MLRLVTDTDVAMRDWTTWMTAQGLSKRTIKDRVQVLRRVLGYGQITPGTLTPEDIISFMAMDVSASTKATYHADIRAFCQWMVKTGVRPDDPTVATPHPRTPKHTPHPVSRADLHLMLSRARTRRCRAYVMLGAYAGLRVHEIAKIRGEDIQSGMLTVTGKGGKTCTVPVHHALDDLVAAMPSSGYWFTSPTAAHIAGTAVSSAVGDLMRRCGIHNTPHGLRHFYATELVRAGVNLRIVQELMRHESPATTAIYARVDLGQMRTALDMLDAA